DRRVAREAAARRDAVARSSSRARPRTRGGPPIGGPPAARLPRGLPGAAGPRTQTRDAPGYEAVQWRADALRRRSGASGRETSMDWDDSPQQAKFRAEVRAVIEEHLP